MNSKNNSQMIFSSEDIKDLVKKTKGIDFRELNQQRKKALQMDKEELLGNLKIASTIDIESLVKSMKLAPKVSDIISKHDINEFLNKVFQQHNFSETIQKSVLHKVSNTEIRFDEPTQEYKIKPMIESEKETVKDYSHIYDFAIKLNEKIVFEMYPFLDSIPSEYVAYIYSIHLLIASLLGEAKHRNQSKLK